MNFMGIDTGKITTTGIVMFGLMLLGLYLANNLVDNFNVPIKPILFFMIVTLVLFSIIKLLSMQGRFDLNTLFPLLLTLALSVAVVVYFPQIIPTSFSAVTQSGTPQGFTFADKKIPYYGLGIILIVIIYFHKPYREYVKALWKKVTG